MAPKKDSKDKVVSVKGSEGGAASLSLHRDATRLSHYSSTFSGAILSS